MLDLTHLKASHFRLPEYVEEKCSRLLREGKSTEHLFTLGKLERGDRLQCIDEVIANFFCRYRNVNRWKCLPESFVAVLEKVGYNMTNPPKVRGVE